MITQEEAELIGFAQPKHTSYLWLQVDDFGISIKEGKTKLSEWFRDEDIDLSHLNLEQLKTLISLLTKP